MLIDNRTTPYQKNNFGKHSTNYNLAASGRNCQFSDETYSIDLDPHYKSTNHNGDGFSVKSGSTYAFSCNNEPITKFTPKTEDDSKIDEIELLRRKKEELLKIQMYVQQSLKDIHSKLNKSEITKANEPVKASQSISGLAQSRMKSSKSKLKGAKHITRNVSRPVRKTEEKQMNSSSKQNTLRSKNPKKVSKKIDPGSSLKLTRNSKQMGENSHSKIESRNQKKHNFMIDEKMNIMTSFDHTRQHVMEKIVQNNITPVYKNITEYDLQSTRRDLSNNTRKTPSQRRDRSMRNVQRDNSTSSYEVLANRAATPDHPKSVHDKYV